MKVLAGDVGGTKTSLAIFEVEGTRLEVLALEKYPSQQYGSLDEIVRQFIEAQGQSCDWGSFGIAGPVRKGRAETTNLPWLVDAKRLTDELGFRKVWLMNDLEANAWGISALEEKDFCVLSEGKPDPAGNASIISAGTGLGQAGLYWNGEQHRPFASEGGHCDFAPHSDLEIALLQYLKQRHPHVSWERVVSGMGLVNIYKFLRDYRGSETPAWLAGEMKAGDQAAAISRAAQASRCPVCSETLELFVHLYGVEAGNQALKIMSTAGVYLGGGIAPKNLDLFREGIFLKGFWSKGRMEPLMRDMPVKVILNDRTALYGPAVFAGTEIG
jgi:glucokinase